MCGPTAGRERTYASAPAEPSEEPSLARDDALARLAHRYLTGHGPASAEDFAWWSGFPVSAARAALDSLPGLHTVRWRGRPLMRLNTHPATELRHSSHLLPPFDEDLIGYRDRELVLAASAAARFNRADGMPRRALLLDGAVAGTWTTSGTARRQRLEVTAYRALTRHELDLVDAAATALRRFYGYDPLPLTVVDA